MNNKSIEERFWSKVKRRKDDECWIWTAGHYGEGKYGAFSISHTKTVGAHVFSWELHNKQKVAKGLFVLHTCDNPPCVNPNHLFLGTPKDNTQDMLSKGRHRVRVVYGAETSQHGTIHWKNKLSEKDVLDIRRLILSGMKQKDIAKLFNTTPQNIHRIKNRDSWSWL